MTSRRAVLRTTGVAALGGLAGLAGCSDSTADQTTSTTAATGDATDTTSTDQTTTDGASSDEGSTDWASLSRFHLSGTTVLEDFEDVADWQAATGTAEAATETSFSGSQSLRLTAPEGTGEALVRTEGDWDLAEQTLSLAINPTSPQDNVVVDVHLFAPDGSNVWKMGELVRVGSNQGWFRMDLAPRERIGEPDLSSVSRIEIRVYDAAGPIDVRVDDLRAVPRPDTGRIVLSFDDSLRSHYTEAFTRMEEYGMPGSESVITGRTDGRKYLTVRQMQEMKDAGWELANHTTQGGPLTTMSRSKMWRTIRDASDWLEGKGLATTPASFVYPHGRFDRDVLEFVDRGHTLGFRYMGPFSAPSGRITDRLTVARGDGTRLDLSKRVVQYTEQYRTNTVLAFHDIATDGGLSMSPNAFQALLDEIDRRDVEVVTFSELAKTGLAD